MNCCKNDNEEDEKSNIPAHNHIKHMMYMVLSCGLPLLILLALPLIR